MYLPFYLYEMLRFILINVLSLNRDFFSGANLIHPFTFNVFVSLYLKNVFYNNTWLAIAIISRLTISSFLIVVVIIVIFNVINDMTGFKSMIMEGKFFLINFCLSTHS